MTDVDQILKMMDDREVDLSVLSQPTRTFCGLPRNLEQSFLAQLTMTLPRCT